MSIKDKHLIRCMGGKFCTHAPGTCTADPEYQAAIPKKETQTEYGPAVNFTEAEKERFWGKVDVQPGSCWNWMAGQDRGYGAFYWKNRNWKAPRISMMLKTGVLLSKDQFVCHSCDNPSCVNPDHLFVGSQADNISDMMGKGRHHFQIRTACSKGHRLIESNIIVDSEGYKRCKECRKASYAALNQRKRQNG